MGSVGKLELIQNIFISIFVKIVKIMSSLKFCFFKRKTIKLGFDRFDRIPCEPAKLTWSRVSSPTFLL
jgi:hypothetical protein